VALRPGEHDHDRPVARDARSRGCLEEFARTDASGAGPREQALFEELHRESESLHGH
jgi:hypothetical protein